jgi:hydroxymethylglutaryl-CoA lyase
MKIPEYVRIIEVGPRDGFQNISEFIPTEKKMKEIELLVKSGVKEIEVTSFVNPGAVPQMRDAVEVGAGSVEKYGDKARIIALVPNQYGAEQAVKCGIKDISFVVSVSETHNRNNVNRTKEKSLTELMHIIRSYPQLKIRFCAATSFGCPFEGAIPEDSVKGLIHRAADLGVREIVLADTIGAADPVQTERLATSIKDTFPELTVGLHMHDTRGLGLANMLAALSVGIERFETSVGGLGGCPFAPGASGNTATEDFLNMLSSMKIRTDVDMNQYMLAAAYVKHSIYPALTGHMISVFTG